MAEKDKQLSDEFLSRLVAELDEESVTTIILHGSYARGDATPPYSDVDIVRIIQENSALPRRKRYIWHDGYLVSFSSRPLSVYRQWLTTPEEAIFRACGVQEARILLEKDTSFRAFQQETQAFRWEPLQEAANAYASQLLLEQTEMVLHLQRAQLLNDRIALMDMTLELFSASTDAIAVQRGVLVKSGNTYYHQVQQSVGTDSSWTRYHNRAAGIDPTIVPSIENRSVAALALYKETVRLLQPYLSSEHWKVIEPLLDILNKMIREEAL
ncbi:MAG TPA: nucleotidyltransferase domain-containing protein [Ktedonosporobacter sp.]|jgi:predicted nucleotidyltransferase|nr:nucleotidyltransferase domain-containing protein [Ktedonosporobacter sp.]